MPDILFKPLKRGFFLAKTRCFIYDRYKIKRFTFIKDHHEIILSNCFMKICKNNVIQLITCKYIHCVYKYIKLSLEFIKTVIKSSNPEETSIELPIKKIKHTKGVSLWNRYKVMDLGLL